MNESKEHSYNCSFVWRTNHRINYRRPNLVCFEALFLEFKNILEFLCVKIFNVFNHKSLIFKQRTGATRKELNEGQKYKKKKAEKCCAKLLHLVVVLSQVRKTLLKTLAFAGVLHDLMWF